MAEYAAQTKAKDSCSVSVTNSGGDTIGGGTTVNSPSCYCDGTVTQNYCTMEAFPLALTQNQPLCKYTATKVLQGKCYRPTQISPPFLDTLCSGNSMEIQALIKTIPTDCNSGSQDVLNFCSSSADVAAHYKADLQCNPDSMAPQLFTCQGDYTIKKCVASPNTSFGGNGNCLVTAISQFQGSCGSSDSLLVPPTSNNLDTSSKGLALKKIHGHKVAVYITRLLPKNILYRALRHINESKDLVGQDWSSYYLGNFTVPLYRPDIGRKIPAYYEIEVYSDPALRKPAGFIVLTNSHPSTKQDNPVAHWNSHGPSMTKQLLTTQGSKKNVQGNPVRTVIWKLDSLCYAASKGSVLVANIGNIPPLLDGLTNDIFNLFSSPDKKSEVIDTPFMDSLNYPTAVTVLPDDGSFKQISWNRTQSGPDRSSIPFRSKSIPYLSF